MFESIGSFFKKMVKPENKELGSKDDAKERLHLVLMQDRANVSADFLELMKQEIIEVIKKYIVVDEAAIDVRLTNKTNEDGTNGAPSLYANIPIINIKNDMKAEKIREFAINHPDISKNDNEIEKNAVVDEVENDTNKILEKSEDEIEINEQEKNIENLEESIADEENVVRVVEENKIEETDKQEKNIEILEEKKEDTRALEEKKDVDQSKEKNITATEKKRTYRKNGRNSNSKKKTDSIKAIDDELEQLANEDDNEDDDVTFDDLLKAAEEKDKDKK